ncbi:MAG: sigma factor-like helix-turn-helix DNA-binding protein [Candidatus Woesearchaeota archaeon]
MEWSRKKLVDAAVDILYSGGHLSSHYLTQNHPDIHNAIYYKGSDGKRKYFNTFLEFRTTVAKRLVEKGDKDLAIKIISPDYKQKIIPEAEDERRKQQTLQALEDKIHSGENIGYRYQKDNHPEFYNNCIRYFKTYRGTFEAKGLDYEEFIVVKRDKEYYGQQLINLLQENPSITKEEILSKHKKLWDRLNNNYGSHRQALHAIAETIRPRDDKLAYRILSLENLTYKSESKKKRLAKERELRSSIKTIEPLGVYTRRDVPEIIHSGKIRGAELYHTLKDSKKYIPTQKAAKITGHTASNIIKNFVHKHPDKILRYQSGTFTCYFFHKSIFEDYTPKPAGKIGSIEAFSRENHILYSKVRSMLDTIGTDSRIQERSRELSDIEKKILTMMLKNEKDTHKRIIESIDKDKEYTINWLNEHGIPMVKLRKLVLDGKIPSRTENGISVISGKDIRTVLNSKKNTFRYLLSMHIPGYFDTGLHSMTQIRRNNDISKYLLKTRAIKLLGEDHSSVYRLSKEDVHRKVMMISDEGKELILNWEERSRLKLEHAITSSMFKHTQSEAIHAKRDLESIMLGPIRRKAIPMFEHINILKNYTNERLLIGDVDVSFKHLYLIYKIMKNVGFTHVDIDRIYSKNEVMQRLDIPKNTSAFAKGTLYDELSKIIETAEFAISQEYDYLVDKMMSRNRLSDTDSRIAGERGLKWAIEHFRGGNFVSFASTLIQKNLQWSMYSNKTISLDKGLVIGDEDYTLKNIIPANPEVSILDIMKTLKENEQKVVEEYLGLDGTKHTFAEIAKNMGINIEDARTIYERAIKKLRIGYDNSLSAILE